METGLLLILSVIGLLALYWVLFGQWHFNRMMREADSKSDETSAKDIQNDKISMAEKDKEQRSRSRQEKRT